MSPVGNYHSLDHAFIHQAIYVYAVLNKIILNCHDNCNYRKAKMQEFQPDLSFYMGDNANIIPGGISIINLDEYPAPNLIIEVPNTSLADELGNKRLLYEDLGVEEYWVIDVNKPEIIAFKMENQGSYRIQESILLKGLKITILNEALKMSRETNQIEIGSWLFEKFKN